MNRTIEHAFSSALCVVLTLICSLLGDIVCLSTIRLLTFDRRLFSNIHLVISALTTRYQNSEYAPSISEETQTFSRRQK